MPIWPIRRQTLTPVHNAASAGTKVSSRHESSGLSIQAEINSLIETVTITRVPGMANLASKFGQIGPKWDK